MTADDLAFAGLARQAELVRAGEVSARELTELSLERIARLDPRLNAFRVVMAERALAEADQADARRQAGDERPLLGVPVAVKDNVDVVGEVTANGTGAHGAPATSEAEVVRRLRAAGAVIVGKTHLPELALWGFTESATWGVTRNPWDPERTPGGSSGGSAAAVAAGLVGAAHASDGLGSIRIPAAACGLFGLKPQRGRVSMLPDAEHWHGLSTFGTVTRGVLDTAVFLDAVMGGAPGDAEVAPAPAQPFAEAARSAPGRLRIALSLRTASPMRVHPVVEQAVRETGALLASLGHDVHEQDPKFGNVWNDTSLQYLRGAHDDAAGMAHPERLERRTRGMRRLGSLVPRGLLDAARARAATASALELFRDHDVLLTATVARPAPPVRRWEGLGPLGTIVRHSSEFAGPLTGPWNHTGQPAASVPAGFTSSGLPLAVQLVGRPNDEPTLLSLAAQLEAERPWAEHRPPVS